MLFSKLINQALFLTVALLLVPLMALAQGGETEGDAFAEINVGDAFMSLTDTEINVSFNITNQGSSPQSDVRYGTELIQATGDGGQVMVDRLVAEETISVAAGESVMRNIKHPLAGVAPGNYSVWVVARTTGGAVLGLTSAGPVTVADSDAVSLLAETCFLTVGDSETKYTLGQGVDIAAEEALRLNCDVVSFGANERSVTPVFAAYRRTSFGEPVAIKDGAVGEVLKMTQGNNEMDIPLPKMTEPQAYDIEVSLKDVATGEVVSNHLSVHYVLRGASATIQTVNFDKTEYKAGEAINVTLFWTDSADNFEDSRSGEPTKLAEAVKAELKIVDGAGVQCADTVSQTVNPGEVRVSAVAKVDCTDPVATLSLASAGGEVFDTRSIEVKSPEVVEAEGQGATTNQNNIYFYIVLAMLAAILTTILLVVARHKKLDVTDGTKMLVLAIVAFGGLLGGAPQAEAVSWTHYWSNSSGSWRMGVAVNANATTYAPGQTINLSSSVWNISCANNVVATHRLTATLGSQTVTLSDTSVNSPTTVYGSRTMTAPTTPGTYYIRATILTKARGETSYRDIPITVVAPAVAAVGSFDSVTPATCSVAGWAFDADSPASSINVSIYRDGPYGTGTHITHCAANQARPDVNAAYGITGNHGFNCTLPASYQGTGSHNLYIHAIDTSNTPNNVITGSPKAMSCAPVSATITGTGCTIPVGGSSCTGTVTWTITGASTPNVYNSNTTSQLSTNTSGTNEPVTLTGGTNQVQSRDGSTSLASADLVAACAAGSAWNGSTCASTSASASISGTGCTMALGESTCNGTVTWDIDNAGSPNVYNFTRSAQLSTSANGTNEPIPLTHGGNQVLARNGGTTLDSVTLTASCSTGSWNGTECANIPAAPVVNLSLDREIVRSGSTANLTIEVTAAYPTTCTITGLSNAPIVINHSGTPANDSYTRTSKPLTSAQAIEASCEPSPSIAGVSATTAETRVSVIPVVEEI